MTRATQRLDEELEGTHGTVASQSSLAEETDPADHAQNPGDFPTKIRREAAAHGGGVVETAKAALRFADRDLAGEYERREDPDAVPSPQAVDPEQLPPGEQRHEAARGGDGAGG